MSKESSKLFLFALAKEIKRSYECPVILLTQNDYADPIFKCLISMRHAVRGNVPTRAILDIVSTFHFDWLHAINDVDKLQKRIKDTPRESVLKSLNYTVQCIKNRYKFFQEHIDLSSKSWTLIDKTRMHDELDVIKNMQEIVGSALTQKLGSLTNSADKTEYFATVLDEIQELLNWIDNLYNHLVLQVCKILELPLLPTQLGKTLQHALEEVAGFLSLDGREVAEALMNNRSTSHPICTFDDADINKLADKIKKLEDRIAALKREQAHSDPTARQHKAIFLQDRLESLENLKKTFSILINKKGTYYPKQSNDVCIFDERSCTEIRIFNHLLPPKVRSRLVENLIQHWEGAINDPESNSIISIIRNDSAEVFFDDLGHFTVDDFGRKLYTKQDDDRVYQVNETYSLVPVMDDQHVYFYDACGRYYLTENKVRIYKANQAASEYMMDRYGMLLKTKETVDGIEYRYDSLGRYYIDNGRNKIYCEEGSPDKYKSDNLGNLLQIRNDDQYDLDTCPFEPMVTEDSIFLKKMVGDALKKCVAEVVIVQPLDPILYLRVADRLKKYHTDKKAKENRQSEVQNIMAKTERIKYLAKMESIKRESPKSKQYEESDAHFTIPCDYNFLNYDVHTE